MAPIPRDREKNIWPPAVASTVRTSGVSCLKVTMRCMTPLISTADIFTPSITAEAGT